MQQGQRCAYCHTMDKLTVDHRLARALGGTNARSNLHVLCKPHRPLPPGHPRQHAPAVRWASQQLHDHFPHLARGSVCAGFPLV
ncbi:HNH endonuclease [Hymenobacter terrestris]|uniref:HNH endonuclease n=1 Tax=Hymenobacter terrestris TaxID=2748310 RepID=UPI00374445A7